MTSPSQGENEGETATFRAALFDLDGVVTRTAQLHAASWKELFDDLLRRRVPAGGAFEPFDDRADYRAFVDGKPRLEGVRSFLRARSITLPEGSGDDPTDALTVQGLARRKDAIFARRLGEQGVETFASTLALIESLRARGTTVGLVTSSRHGREIVRAAGIERLFDALLDGLDLEERGLRGKPAPDMFIECAGDLGEKPGRALVFEDAVAGVQAGRRGSFGLVVGIDRGGNAVALQGAGADIVVQDLAELTLEQLEARFAARQEEISWYVEQEGFDETREHTMESLFVVGNGYLGVRGALDAPLPGSEADLFVAGVYDRKCPRLPYSEVEFTAPARGARDDAELVPLPFPFRLKTSLDGVPLDFSGPHWRELRRRLDLRRGLVQTEARFETPDGRRTVLRTLRCASMADPHLLLQEMVATPENHWAAINLEALLEEPDRTRLHIEQIEHARVGEIELVRYATSALQVEICIGSRVFVAGEATRPHVLRRAISVFTTRDGGEPRAAVLAHLGALDFDAFDDLIAAHEARWREFWAVADIRVQRSPASEQALRFASYHLKIAVGDDSRVSVPARALSGRAYEGHVFWDTEIFMLPFYLHTAPAQAKNLLLYRHRTLEGARRRARSLGLRGACFAWESTVTGDDVTPAQIVLRSSGETIPIFTGTQQVHVTADIAYATWRYWEATGDEEFLSSAGAEILFETARFWTSRATRAERAFHIRGVVGPDEYHHDVNDNAYTNWMARFNLERAAWVADWLGRSAPVSADEPRRWQEVAQALHCPGPNREGVIEQFAGFFDLEPYPLPGEERFRAPISRLFDWEKINRMQLVKQADVLMLPLLFPDAFSDEIVAANYHFYEPITDHGSSLSPPVHAAIAARLGLRADAERYWRQSLWLDLSNAMKNSALGVHPAAMGATWQALVFGFLGVRFGSSPPEAHVRPAALLPDAWRSVALTLLHRGRPVAIQVRATGGAP